MEKESQNLNDTVLTKEELLQLKGGSAIIESSRDIHNINSTSGCSCVYLNHNVIINRNSARECSCVCRDPF